MQVFVTVLNAVLAGWWLGSMAYAGLTWPRVVGFAVSIVVVTVNLALLWTTA